MAAASVFLKPLAWIATAGFLVGFAGYFAVGQPGHAAASTALQVESQTELASGPASDEWNLPKHI